jgi:hypothetical protein
VTGAGRRRTVPQQANAARQVALGRDGVIVGRAEDHRIAVLFALAPRGRQRAAFALAVVQRADDQRPVERCATRTQQVALASSCQWKRMRTQPKRSQWISSAPLALAPPPGLPTVAAWLPWTVSFGPL